MHHHLQLKYLFLFKFMKFNSICELEMKEINNLGFNIEIFFMKQLGLLFHINLLLSKLYYFHHPRE